MGLLPRGMSRKVGAAIGWLAYAATPRLRRVGLRNLELAFPEKPEAERETILRAMYRQLGWQLAEFCHMPGYSLERANQFIRYEGLEHYLTAKQRGKGVLSVNRTSGRVGDVEFLSLAGGLSDGHGDSEAG